MSFENFNVLDYGADPLGKTDSYQAFQDWANAITAQGGGTGLVPPGIYKIDKVLDWDGGNIYNSDIRNFVFDQCNGLHLIGFGATINLKGDNIRKTQEHELTLDDGTIFYYSYLRMVGFVIQNCNNVCIEGFDINDNANLVEQDSDNDHPFVEGGDDILSICGSRNVILWCAVASSIIPATVISPVSSRCHNFPFSGGISAIGDAINLGRQRIQYGGASAPTSGSFNQGDLIFNNNVNQGESMGWVCVVKGTAGVEAEFRAMPPVGV